ncbi:ATP-binding protein [Chamaesiphon minutus]|uniref:histidine kinase n=1 Tax=Chamaesiphon minutus (strain ATCC 27169 / PCC 6605) TaxID=1173020 RepID=K9UJR2_CHAP6|nr:ATP-binding protein [Chamaesiphon minutus]AFY95317.1 bacteriophytochrome (light-regulated signal transduction histidine kinase) [Chamaesiphon minutus PCC 6605]
MNTNFQKLTILIVDDSSFDCGIYSAYILDRHSFAEPTHSIGGVGDVLEICQERSPDLVLLNFARGNNQDLKFIADLQLVAEDSNLPPIWVLPDLANRERDWANLFDRKLIPANLPSVEIVPDLTNRECDLADELERELAPAELFLTPLSIVDRQSVAPQPPERELEIVSLREEIAKTKGLLAQRDRELAAFTALASYALRAPLKGIANLATWLAEDLESCLTPDTRKQFDLLQVCVRKMQLLIQDLLAYTQADRQPIARSVFNVSELLTQIIGSFSLGAEFTIEVASPMPRLRTDRVALQQVLTYLIDNGVRHHDRPDGKVRIVAQPQRTGYLFEISDDGPGIARQDRERIFEVFQKLSLKQDNLSTGMGLAIAKKKIELQGGKIWIDSTPGVGSKFSFTWPDPSSMMWSP